MQAGETTAPRQEETIGAITPKTAPPIALKMLVTEFDQALVAAEAAWQQGQAQGAIEQARRAIRLIPDRPEPYRWLGNGLQGQGQWAAADRAYGWALHYRPDWAEVWANRGTIALQQQDWATATEHYQQAIQANPELPDLHLYLAQSLCQQCRWPEAAAAIEQALQRNPDRALAHLLQSWIALDHEAGDDPELAYAAVQRSLALDPHYPGAWFQLGRVCFYRQEFREAIAAHQRGLTLAPPDPGVQARALGAIGNCHFELAELAAAADCYEAALRHQPDEADVHWGRANLWLHQGDYERGFAEFEWRWPNVLPRRPFQQPAWNGEPIAGQTILVYAQCGLGDILHLARYLPLLAARGARVVVESPQPTARILAALPGVAQVVVQGAALPAFDWQISFLSLPKVFTPSLAAIPRSIPYLSAQATDWRPEQDFTFRCDRLHVGIAWASGYQANRDGRRDYHNRSIPLAQFVEHLNCPEVQLHSLQVGHDAGAIAQFPQVQAWHDRLRDFADTAALVAQMDLVICVDTSVTHLAGGLGLPTWILLPQMPNWRWMLDRTDCPWYPTARLFRQLQPRDWAGVWQQVRPALAQAIDQWRSGLAPFGPRS
ncbi:tetratricopeptide repeat protein [Limnothrix sp. FACHB-881]|uniref:tetratricopeptide repeat-containing glycosyltransferase family protein n=1 Tax=Limnothrix sp. FACHB-881 TaxID=2692819 RepID=UPI00168A2980|nr:tetratricopeptide repeat-containing glycosyltransferase family protein [Limnothrix sp. FACHB-881]MBD2635185.1 tetratricopeptide repeat protein [Limnothrix sp. FACHB-881]